MYYTFPMEKSDGKQELFISADTGFVLAMESGGCPACGGRSGQSYFRGAWFREPFPVPEV
jgi:hypothetical protein